MKKLALISILLCLGVMAYADVEVGKSAPEFTLKDAEGKNVSLADFKGKIVVLEWFNHGCPFVAKHYGAENMQKLQQKLTREGVVWLSICSSAPGKQGYETPEGQAKMAREVGSHATAVLIDDSGKVGKLYGAKTTPDTYVINKDGILAYHGAIDSKPTTNPGDIADATNYVEVAVNELLAGKKVSVSETKPYGCSVKY